MMKSLEKSDSAIVAVKQANKGRQRSAEPVEPRAGANGNSESRSMSRAQKRGIMSHGADRIRQAAKRNPKERLVALLHHITVPALMEAFYSLKSDVAAGVDGVTWEMYADGLQDRLVDLHGRLHRGGAYQVPPVRRVEIPKSDGGKLGFLQLRGSRMGSNRSGIHHDGIDVVRIHDSFENHVPNPGL